MTDRMIERVARWLRTRFSNLSPDEMVSDREGRQIHVDQMLRTNDDKPAWKMFIRPPKELLNEMRDANGATLEECSQQTNENSSDLGRQYAFWTWERMIDAALAEPF